MMSVQRRTIRTERGTLDITAVRTRGRAEWLEVRPGVLAVCYEWNVLAQLRGEGHVVPGKAHTIGPEKLDAAVVDEIVQRSLQLLPRDTTVDVHVATPNRVDPLACDD